MLQRISAGSLCALFDDAVRADYILLRADLNLYLSCTYLTVLGKSSSMVDGRLNALFRYGPKLVRRLFLLCRSCLDVWKRPFEVEGKVKVSHVLTLRNNVTDESTTVEVSKVRL